MSQSLLEALVPSLPSRSRCAATALLLCMSAEYAAGQSPPTSLTRLGAADDYGPGITAVSRQLVAFQLTRPAHVIVLRVEQDGSIEPVFPVRPADRTEYQIGPHSFEAIGPTGPSPPPEVREPMFRSPDAVARAGRRAPPPGEDLGGRPSRAAVYWLVIVSDVPTSAGELRAQLESSTRTYRSVKVELEALPRLLVAKRAGSWGAYYAATN